MSTYLVIEPTVRDEKLSIVRLASHPINISRQFGGEVIVFGPWESLFGERAYEHGMISVFPHKTPLWHGTFARLATLLYRRRRPASCPSASSAIKAMSL